LAELGAHGVGGIAEEGEAVTVPLFHADIAVAGGEDLVPVIDLIEQIFRSWAEGENFVFPCFQRALANVGVVGDADAPEEAEEFVVVV
jgi:hypothetical protein